MSIQGRKATCPGCGTKLRSPPKLECPSCGELIPKNSKKCPICNVEISRNPSRAKSKSVKKTADQHATDLAVTEPPQTKEQDNKPACPKCGTLLIGTESKCPKCDQEPVDESGIRCQLCGTTVKKGLRVCPSCGFAVDRTSDVAEHVVSPDSTPVDKSPSRVRTRKRVDSQPCPSCGVMIPKSLKKCPVCLASLVVTKPQEEAARTEAQLPKVQPLEDTAPASEKVEAEAIKPTKKRILKTAKVAAVPAPALKSAGGRTNGVGHVNGLRKTSDADAVRGESFVNGSGISNGLGARSKGSSAGRASFLTRWQFLAVLVALVIVISTFVFLSYSNSSEKFSIDGDFADWAGSTTYGSVIQSTAPATNITEWSIATQSSDLFFYLRTQANMMSSPNAESYYLFVDSDGSNATGYVMESIGADYMLELTGWDSAVRSTSLSRYSSSSDQYNWTAWTSISSLSYSLDNSRLEARATMPEALGQTAMFVLVTKDSADRGSVSCTAPLKGGVLVIEQVPSADVAATGVLPKSASVKMLTLKFKSEGQGGSVDNVNPTVTGAPLANQVPAFSLGKGEKHEITITVDTSGAPDGRLVAIEMLVSGIVSSFAHVEVIGSGASAYVGSPLSVITIDGAFADWTGRTSVDQDPIPASSPSTNINQVGNVNTTHDSYFYVSVIGEICSGTFVPATVSKPVGSGGGGTVNPARRTAEDILRIFVDSDRSISTGKQIALDSKLIGADQLIEVKGLFGRITSMKEFGYSSDNWEAMPDVVGAAKDTKRMEISVSAASLGGSADIDFIVETTSWKGRSDLATFDPSSMSALAKAWIVDPSTASPYATSMSYQRKTFYDGMNYWSFFFNGTNTVYKYSVDNGQTWTYSGAVFTTKGVNETSIWYDSSTSTVYAVGDTSTATNAVLVQVGTVDASAHTISWAASDSGLKTSSFALAGKNTYISKDSNGYLWVLSSNCTRVVPTAAYQLSAFRTSAANNVSSWVLSGQILAVTSTTDNVKGSIVPAGSGSDMWAVYAFMGFVAARKYNGTWQAQQIIYTSVGSRTNTDNSPPSVVVDGKGVVHVVYGTGRRNGGISTPFIIYSHNNTGLTTFTSGLNLDPLIATGIGDYYPTISLDNSTGNLYALWLRSDATPVPRTVMGRMNVSGVWSDMTFDPQTNFAKQYLTSVYSVSGGSMICWQWTQNTTAPSNVLFDRTQIPELGSLILPTIGLIVIFAVCMQRSRSQEDRIGRRARR